ncbi:MAG: hypothetical protein WBR15_02890 [Gammaproteobacteria bacterium]
MQHLEDAEQKALMGWARITPLRGSDVIAHATLSDYLIAYPNGGKRLYTEAARMAGLGVKKGVVDLFLPLARHGFHGLWIEMKKPIHAFPSRSAARDAVTDEQESWICKMEKAGHAAAPCYGWDEARTLLEEYLAEGVSSFGLFNLHCLTLRLRFEDIRRLKRA